MSNKVESAYNTRSKVKQTIQVNGPITRRMARELTYKKEEESSDDDEDYDDEDYEEEYDDDIEEDEDMSQDEDDILSEGDDDFIVKDKSKINRKEFQNLLSELFPSKYMENKMKREGAPSPEPVTGSEFLTGSNRIPLGTRAPIKKQKHNTLVEEEPISPRRMHSPMHNPMQNFNIIFTVGSGFNIGSENKDIEDYESYNSSDDPDYDPDMEEVEDDSSPIDSEMEEELDQDEEDQDEVDQDEVNQEESCCNMDTDNMPENIGFVVKEGTKCKDTKCKDTKCKDTKYKNSKKPYKTNNTFNGKNQFKSHAKKLKFKNALKFKELLQQKNVMNDLNYFQEKMSLEEQEVVLRQMEEIKSIIDIEKPYRLALLAAEIPARFKASAYNKLSTLKNMEPGCSEYNKIKHWVDDFMRIPFNKINHLPVRIEDGVDKCHDFMADAKNTLDKAVYGLNDVKLQVMQMVGQWITNPDAIGNAVAIEGPPGTGKTTLVKEGISKILNREFVFIPLGGATDSSCLEGHSYTYEGSSCGLIVKQLIQCQSMNPIIYFDELDKISDTPKGDEIVGILTHLTDTSQNSNFHDKYFAEFDFDLSRCVFFFSYNDRSKVNKILLDRMHCIMTKGYELPQKAIIAKDYLLPTIRSQVKFKPEEIILPEETVEHIINTHTHKEDGVRNLKRCLEIIHTKLNLYRLMKPGTNLFEGDMDIKVEFPITITPKIVDKLIKQNKESGTWMNMYS
jgi:ATP-dependent Lon protease